jgi:ribose-phosphate pyrophosphokinase
MKIFSGTSSQRLTEKICKILNKQQLKFSSMGVVDEEITPGKLKIDKFSDGEILPLFGESVRDEDVFFVQTTNSSDNIMETLLVIDAAKRAGCKSFTLVAPFQSYSRQDKTDHLRSSIGSKMLADILSTAGMNRIITIDLHASAIQGFYNVPVIHLNGNKIFIDYIRENAIDDLTIVAPDQGAVKRASDFCKAFPESTFVMINKKRIKPNEIHSMELVGDVTGRNVVIVDDMADTLGTMCKAAELLMEKGAKSVRCIATHGILSGKAIENLYNSKITELLVSDSIPLIGEKDSSRNDGKSSYISGVWVDYPVETKMKVISCDRIIGKSIWGLVNKQSIHELNAI